MNVPFDIYVVNSSRLKFDCLTMSLRVDLGMRQLMGGFNSIQ